MRRLLLTCSFAVFAALGCGPGDITSDSADSGNENTVEDLDEECVMGCAYFEMCAPAEYDTIYPNGDCVDACHELYDGCVSEAITYFECLTSLTCENVQVLVTQGPAATECGPSFEAAESACGR